MIVYFEVGDIKHTSHVRWLQNLPASHRVAYGDYTIATTFIHRLYNLWFIFLPTKYHTFLHCPGLWPWLQQLDHKPRVPAASALLIFWIKGWVCQCYIVVQNDLSRRPATRTYIYIYIYPMLQIHNAEVWSSHILYRDNIIPCIIDI